MSGASATSTPPPSKKRRSARRARRQKSCFCRTARRRGIFKQPNAADLLVAILGIAPHLDDVQPGVFVEGDGHRIGHQRLGGDLLDAKSGRDLECLQRLGRLGRRNPRQFARIIASTESFGGCASEMKSSRGFPIRSCREE